MALADPVIVVPGLAGSTLRDEYPLPPETRWSALRRDVEGVALHPDDLRYEARGPARVAADAVLPVAYRELVEELRHDLAERPDRPVPVHAFAYDWRRPLAEIEASLAEFVDEVIDRTRLLRHYHAAGFSRRPRVSLVAHSMGGVIAVGLLERLGRRARVGRVATLGAPFRGSFEAVAHLTTGTGLLEAERPRAREREAARITPSLYQLLPSFDGALETDGSLPGSLFAPDVWQPSVVETLARYVQDRGLSRRGARARAEALFAELLGAGRAHRKRLEGFRLSRAGLRRGDFLCVVAVDAATRVRLRAERHRGAPRFVFRDVDRRNRFRDPDPAARAETGDGTVPLEGALPAFLPRESLVCVTPDDLGAFELQDRAAIRLAGFHALLPTMDLLHRLVVRHLTGRPDRYGNTWGRRAPGARAFRPPIPGLRERP